MRFDFDHALIAVHDLDTSARRFLEDYGLASVPGGRHPGHGTANRIIPLGSDYVELIAVVDHDEAKSSPLGTTVARLTESRAERLFALCLRTDSIIEVAARLDSPAVPMHRERPDGAVLEWKLAGLEITLLEPSLPFFIQWNVTRADHPGASVAEHRSDPSGIAWVSVAASAEDLDAHIGPHALDIRSASHGDGVVEIGIETSGDPIVLH